VRGFFRIERSHAARFVAHMKRGRGRHHRFAQSLVTAGLAPVSNARTIAAIKSLTFIAKEANATEQRGVERGVARCHDSEVYEPLELERTVCACVQQHLRRIAV
jgi:hypothetical protein